MTQALLRKSPRTGRTPAEPRLNCELAAPEYDPWELRKTLFALRCGRGGGDAGPRCFSTGTTDPRYPAALPDLRRLRESHLFPPLPHSPGLAP